ncbi:hypothetical protein HMI55_000226 [Coelomomyces lativittatus]|nr:hypothetical protein HMI55_000226 [Coelomomyces lativittatus]
MKLTKFRFFNSDAASTLANGVHRFIVTGLIGLSIVGLIGGIQAYAAEQASLKEKLLRSTRTSNKSNEEIKTNPAILENKKVK